MAAMRSSARSISLRKPVIILDLLDEVVADRFEFILSERGGWERWIVCSGDCRQAEADCKHRIPFGLADGLFAGVVHKRNKGKYSMAAREAVLISTGVREIAGAGLQTGTGAKSTTPVDVGFAGAWGMSGRGVERWIGVGSKRANVKRMERDPSHLRPSQVLGMELVHQLFEGLFSCPTGRRHALEIS
jgi:hypothetical protein